MNESPELLDAAREMYRERNTLDGMRRWSEFAEAHPAIAQAALPKPDAGVGSDEKRYAPGICWRDDDRNNRMKPQPAPFEDGFSGSTETALEADKARPHRLGVCEVCGKRLPSGWEPMDCEFDPPMMGCRCGGCNPWPKTTKGRRRYCSPECEREMANALRKAQRVAQGKKPRQTDLDPFAYARATYKVDFRDRARQSEADRLLMGGATA